MAITLWRQITPWLLLLLALAVLAAGLGYDRYHAYGDLDARECQRLVEEANAVRENLSVRLQTSSNALAALRSDLPGYLTQAEGLSRLNRRLAALVTATEGLRTLLVVDVNGIALASNRPELIGKNFREQERYQTMSRDANPDRLYVSAPFKTPLGLWAMSLGRVIPDDLGRFNGYVLAILDPDYYRLLLNTTLYAPDMRVSVIHGDGLVVFRTPDPEGLTGQNVLAQPHSFYRRFRDSGAERLPIAYQSVDSEGRWLDANQQMADLLGFASPEEMIGQSFVDYWDASIRNQFDANFERFKASHSIDGEVPLRRRDGSPLTVLSVGRIQHDDEGRFLRTHCILIDITERRAMEDQIRALNEDLELKVAQRTAELSRSEARARAFMHTALDAVVVIDQKSCILEFNRAAETLFGYPAEEILGQPLATLMAPGDAGQHHIYVAASKGQGARRMGGNRQVLGRHRSGRDFPVEISVGSLLEGDQRLHVGIIRDVSERVRFEAALEDARQASDAASAAKSEFLAHMSHEIRTPLNGVLGLVHLLQREPLTPDQREMVTRIQGAGQSLLAILNDILDFSKIEAGQLRLEDRPFRLDALLAKLDSLLGPVARGKGLALRIEGPDATLGHLRGDALRLEQILINLVGNAIKFTEAGEVTVTLTTRANDPAGVRLRCAVRDTGIGIGPEALARLFTPFTQADASTTRRFGGTGLGLSICMRLVELMGGTLGADSVPGTGSTFWCELPFRRAADDEVPVPAAPVAALPVGPRLRGLRILAVDDSPINRDLVERALRMEGAQVSLAGDGQQALLTLQASPAGCDAVLMDVQMPVLDGLSAMRRIRADLGLKELPLLALTAGVLPEQQQAARDAGADAVLAKPLDLEHLVNTLRERVGPLVLARAAAQAGPAAQADSGAPERPATGGDFPLIAGIDRVRAALSFDQDRDFFLLLLGRFVTEAASAVAEIRAWLADGERETATRRMHSLKGNAGNLGALDLMQAAGALETALQQGATDLDADLAALDRQLEDLAAASAPWLAAADLQFGEALAQLDRRSSDPPPDRPPPRS